MIIFFRIPVSEVVINLLENYVIVVLRSEVDLIAEQLLSTLDDDIKRCHMVRGESCNRITICDFRK